VAVLAVFLAVFSSLGYGVADFVGGLATRRAPVLRVVVLTVPASLVTQAALLPLLGARWSAGALLWGAASGLASAAAFGLLYQSLALGPMGVLSPVTAVVSAVLPAAVGRAQGERLDLAGVAGFVLAIAAVVAVSAGPSAGSRPTPVALGLAQGERLDLAGVAGFVLAIAAVVAVSAGPSAGSRPTPVALGLALAAGAAIGLMLTGLSQSPHDSGLAPLLTGRAVSAVVVLLAARLARPGGQPPGRQEQALAIAAGVFDALANVAFLLAVRHGSLVVVAVITALYPGGTVLLARQVLGERLTRIQLGGLVVAAAAVTLLALS
jgi:drug/metabolite transporter (DMT)-like permease